VHQSDGDERAQNAPNPAYRAGDADPCCPYRGWIYLRTRKKTCEWCLTSAG
jgi:hypothetical protein